MTLEHRDFTRERLAKDMEEAERKAWDSLARYKFVMFGYWAGVWVHLNRCLGASNPNPWRELVRRAKEETKCSG